MNQNLGLLGKKLGNTQIFTDDGEVRRVTVVEMGPCLVVGKRSTDKHGYSALQLAFGKKKAKGVTKPEAGPFAKLGVDVPEVVKEIRVTEETAAKFQVGQAISLADVFTEGQHVDVSATSKGHGYTGVMKRHNMKGYKRSHGQHEYQRHGGSIGTNMTPGRVLPGKRMAGQHGNSKVTVQNLKVTKVLADQGLVLVEGSVPGPRGGVVTMRHAAKKPAKA
ncbi:MAG: 50S ribosomal protein L3 [Myxococcota bacterium]|jgi:large subunit ribosomal protein L3|nr:50S ribosomal protein L3 [Myxococcota bacterium]